MSNSRQLAAIMFTDIVGYTAMMQVNEQKAVAVFKHYNIVLEKIVAANNGSVLNNYGDGSLCTFPNTSDAVHCAISMQDQLQIEPIVPLRIGLHVGEIFFEEGKVLGDGVNMASRIQSLGQANTILFSGEIQDKIRNHPEFKSVSLGFFEFKNVEKPVEVYALGNEGLHVPERKTLEGKLKEKKYSRKTKWLIAAGIIAVLAVVYVFYSQIISKTRFTGKEKSIAVLPFTNMSNDKENEYFSDGITEEITTQLSKIADLKVIARTSSMLYKNSKKNVTQIAEELGVAAILEGSVQKSGNQVRIIAQLIDAKTQENIWAEKYDRSMNEIFAIQSEVAEQITNQLNARLTADEKKKIEKEPTQNIAAYDDYLKGKQVLYDWSSPDYINKLEQAEKNFLKALEKDSSFALAWAGLSHAYCHMAGVKQQSLGNYYLNKSITAAIKGIMYGPELSETYMVLGDILKKVTMNPASSLEALYKAINLNPNNAEAYSLIAFALMEAGMFREAEIYLEQAKQFDPLSVLMKTAWFQYYTSSRNAEGLQKFKEEFKKQEINLHYFNANVDIWIHFLTDQYDSLLIFSSQSSKPFWMGIAYAKLGQTTNAEIMIDTLKARSESDNAVGIGIIYAWMNEKEKAMDLLDKAYGMRSNFLSEIKVAKYFDPLRKEKRFIELLRKMGME